jgi:hypothetical protein
MKFKIVVRLENGDYSLGLRADKGTSPHLPVQAAQSTLNLKS